MSTVNDSSNRLIWPYVVVGFFSLVGLGDAVFLTVQDLTGQALRCTLISGCSEVLASKYAHIGSIPLATIGAIAYFLVFSLATLSAFDYKAARPLLLVLVCLMFLMTLWLLYLQAFVIHHFCQYCLLSAAVTIVLVLIVSAISIANRRAAQ